MRTLTLSLRLPSLPTRRLLWYAQVRRACWDGMRTIGDFVLANGFVELVAARNKMAKALAHYAD